MLITFPEGMYVEGEEYLGRRNRLTSVLLSEEIPGVKWRVMAFEEKPRDTPMGEDVAHSFGWIDTRVGPIRDQIPEYSEYGLTAIYQLLLNLFLTLDHGYLAGRNVQPKLPKSPGKVKRLLRKKSGNPYTVINLTAAEREASKRRSEESAARDAEKRNPPRRHIVRGHWRTYWVQNPEGRIIVGTRENAHRPFKIAKYVSPFYRGVERPGDDPRRYKVIAPGWKMEGEDD
jgi:hypothetical protein